MADDQLNFIFEDLVKYTAKEMVGLTLEVTAVLQEDTPRDTGWARANWVPSIGQAYVQLPNVTDPTPADVASAQAFQAQALTEILAYDDLALGFTFVTNNVPYITALNEGHSAQAPTGFVQIGVEKAVRDWGRASGGRRP